jgi:hypothetical protein
MQTTDQTKGIPAYEEDKVTGNQGHYFKRHGDKLETDG